MIIHNLTLNVVFKKVYTLNGSMIFTANPEDFYPEDCYPPEAD